MDSSRRLKGLSIAVLSCFLLTQTSCLTQGPSNPDPGPSSAGRGGPSGETGDGSSNRKSDLTVEGKMAPTSVASGGGTYDGEPTLGEPYRNLATQCPDDPAKFGEYFVIDRVGSELTHTLTTNGCGVNPTNQQRPDYERNCGVAGDMVAFPGLPGIFDLRVPAGDIQWQTTVWAQVDSTPSDDLPFDEGGYEFRILKNQSNESKFQFVNIERISDGNYRFTEAGANVTLEEGESQSVYRGTGLVLEIDKAEVSGKRGHHTARWNLNVGGHLFPGEASIRAIDQIFQ